MFVKTFDISDMFKLDKTNAIILEWIYFSIPNMIKISQIFLYYKGSWVEGGYDVIRWIWDFFR